jgi:8-oxo-dGTP diphosphatase
MRRAVRAIIIHENQLLVMHRNKFGKEYDTLPGGNIEIGETPEQALLREVGDETSVLYKNPRLVFAEEAGAPYGTQYVYVCDYVSGTPALKHDSEEAAIHRMGQNLYEPKWLSLDDLPSVPFVSERLKRAILHALKNGFPEQPIYVR